MTRPSASRGLSRGEAARRFRAILRRARKSKPPVPRGRVLRQVLDFPAWRASLSDRSSDLLEAGVPWLTYPAIRFLRARVRSDWRVFEFGSGGSSVFLADRVAELVSVEHDEAWHAKIVAGGHRDGRDQWTLLLVPPESGASPGAFASAKEGWAGLSFERYCRSIEASAGSGFDLVLVDGRARPDCLALAAARLRPGGYLVLDDSQRARYRAAVDRVDSSFVRFDFPGARPSSFHAGRTTIWRRPRAP